MSKLVTWIKNILKRFLPPPVHAFNREIGRVLETIRQSNNETLAQTEHLNQKNAQIRQMVDEQNRMLAEQRAILDRQNAVLMEQTKMLSAQSGALKQQHALMENHTESLVLSAEGQKRLEENLKEMRVNQQELFQKLTQSVRHVEQVIPNKPIYWKNEFERRIVRENWGSVTEQPDFAEKFVRLTTGLDPKSVEAIIRILSRQKKYLGTEQASIDLFTRQEQEELRLLQENFNSEILKISDNLYAYKNYLLPVNHFESSVFYYKHGIGQLRTCEKVKGTDIVDVGGFIGDSVLVLNELAPRAIYTFEAAPENFELLKETVSINHIPNVVAENVALGSAPGTMTMHLCGSGSTTIDRPGMNYCGDIEVPVITFDDYAEKHDLHVGLIKVDIEGGEPAFLAGAKKTICQQKPILLISIYHNAHDFFELKPLIESWNLGYRFEIHKPTYGNVTSETLLLCEIT